MPNPLQSGISPVAPAPNEGQSAQPDNQAPPQQAGPQQQPAPDHTQTVAALRHFHAIEGELNTLVKNPNLGRSDVKSAIIDGVTKLVAMRMMTPAQAVMQLGEVPSNPIEQRKWVMQHVMQNQKAADFVLDHHRVAHAGVQDMPQGSPDNHMQDVSGLMQSHYGNRRGG